MLVILLFCSTTLEKDLQFQNNMEENSHQATNFVKQLKQAADNVFQLIRLDETMGVKLFGFKEFFEHITHDAVRLKQAVLEQKFNLYDNVKGNLFYDEFRSYFTDVMSNDYCIRLKLCKYNNKAKSLIDLKYLKLNQGFIDKISNIYPIGEEFLHLSQKNANFIFSEYYTVTPRGKVILLSNKLFNLVKIYFTSNFEDLNRDQFRRLYIEYDYNHNGELNQDEFFIFFVNLMIIDNGKKIGEDILMHYLKKHKDDKIDGPLYQYLDIHNMKRKD